jgi:DUF971 family protein
MALLYLTEARRQPAERLLKLTWNDGHSAEYPYDYLRGYCPCAVCQGHEAVHIRFFPPRASVDLVRIEPVGQYGLSLVFSDGHGTGIYRFEFLREIEPRSETG